MSEALSFIVGAIVGSMALATMMASGIETSTKRGFMTVGGQLYLVTPAKPTASP